MHVHSSPSKVCSSHPDSLAECSLFTNLCRLAAAPSSSPCRATPPRRTSCGVLLHRGQKQCAARQALSHLADTVAASGPRPAMPAPAQVRWPPSAAAGPSFDRQGSPMQTSVVGPGSCCCRKIFTTFSDTLCWFLDAELITAHCLQAALLTSTGSAASFCQRFGRSST